MIMEYYVAQKVKDSWGDKPCDHPHLGERILYRSFPDKLCLYPVRKRIYDSSEAGDG